MSKLFYSLLFTIISLHSFAQHQITGHVSSEFDESLVGTNIYIAALEKGTISDVLGNFILDDVPNGDHQLIFSYLGFKTQSINISIKDASVIDLKISLVEDLNIIQCPIIVTSNWLNVEDPYAYTNLNKEEIKERNQGQDVPYLLQDMASVVVSSDAGAGVGYTGIRVRGSDPTRTNVTINGIPFNDSESQGTYWVNLPDFAGSVDQIQLHKGVGPSVVGAGAFGATLNLNTNAISTNKGLGYSGSYGSFNTIKNSISGQTGLLKSGFSAEGRLSLITSDGFIDRASSDLKSAFLGLNYIKNKQSFRFNLFHGHEITYQAWNGVPVQYINDDETRTYNSAGTDKPGEPYDTEVDNYRQTHLQGFYIAKINQKLDFNLALHYTKGFGYFENYKGSEALSDFGIAPIIQNQDTTFVADLIRRKYLDNDFYGIIPTINYKSDKLRMTAGAGINRYIGHHYGEVIDVIGASNYETQEFYRNQSTKVDANIFTKVNYDLTPYFSLYVDGQVRNISYDYQTTGQEGSLEDKNVKHTFINPKAGLNYRKGRSTTYLSISKGSKEPSRNDYVDVSVQDIPLAETMIDYELGYQYKKGNTMGFRANAYFMDYDNQLVLTGALNDVGDALRNNVKDSYRLGLELEGEYNIFKGAKKKLGIQGFASFSKNQIKETTFYIDNWSPPYTQRTVLFKDTPIAFSPEFVGGLNILYNIYSDKKNDFDIGFNEKYVGDQYLDNSGSSEALMDGYFNETFILSYKRDLNRKFDLGLRFTLNNVFDRKYITNGWIYRFDSEGYNPVPDDATAMAISGDNYALKGLFPQAGRYFIFTLNLGWK